MKTPHVNKQIAKNDLISALTDGIGAYLGRSIRASYRRLFERVCKDAHFKQLDYITRQEIVDILALAIFYSEVISPLESGQSFLSLTRKAKATHVRIAKDKISLRVGRRFGVCVNAFQKILRTHHIPVDVLSFSTITSLINNVCAAKETAQREAMDRSQDSD